MTTTCCSKCFFEYGKRTIEYSLLFAERKTLEIAVHPDRRVVVKAPLNSDLSVIEQKLHKRARWILRQLTFFEQFNPKTPERRYVRGESHLYLGRKYRLKICQDRENSVKLSRGRFLVTCRKEPTPETVKKLLENWYARKAALQFHESLERCWPKFQEGCFTKPVLAVKRLRKRWGSLSGKGTLTLNRELVKAPKECIDYVVFHELCHLKHPDHSPDFYKRLDSVVPEWEKIKHKLEICLA
jgi:predicted metal-dependent hydrolase